MQPAQNWKEIVTLTVGFGHGISVTPLHVVRGTAAIANGGILMQPTILALQPGEAPQGERVMQQSTSDIMRKLMRLVVTDGFGKTAEVPGYYLGGKTGTAEKVAAHGGYKKHANVAAFMSVFPMNAPRYAVYMMLDEPQATKATYGYATAGWVAAPAAGKVIARDRPDARACCRTSSTCRRSTRRWPSRCSLAVRRARPRRGPGVASASTGDRSRSTLTRDAHGPAARRGAAGAGHAARDQPAAAARPTAKGRRCPRHGRVSGSLRCCSLRSCAPLAPDRACHVLPAGRPWRISTSPA